MPRKCPKCESYSLDYKSNSGVWRCVKVECDYVEEEKKDEKNPHLISILASNKE